MERRITTHDYFRMPETNRPAELIYGVLREPPAPFYGHQRAVGQLFQLLRQHVLEFRLGDVCVSPMDVVLDEAAGLIVQPDVMFISNERIAIIRDHVWGAPDLVVEVASPTTEHRDRTIKLSWYRSYGVRECWLVYPPSHRIHIVDCATGTERSFTGTDIVRSWVLPGMNVTVDDCCE